MTYHYIDSGLDNVVLDDGYHITETPYGEGVSIEKVDALHDLIGRTIIDQGHGLNGAELRFLRIEMDLTQAGLALLVGTEEQTLRRWEKARSKPIPGPADRILRALYQEFIGEARAVRPMVERLARSEGQPVHARLHFKRTRQGWSLQKAALVDA